MISVVSCQEILCTHLTAWKFNQRNLYSNEVAYKICVVTIIHLIQLVIYLIQLLMEKSYSPRKIVWYQKKKSFNPTKGSETLQPPPCVRDNRAEAYDSRLVHELNKS